VYLTFRKSPLKKQRNSSTSSVWHHDTHKSKKNCLSLSKCILCSDFLGLLLISLYLNYLQGKPVPNCCTSCSRAKSILQSSKADCMAESISKFSSKDFCNLRFNCKYCSYVKYSVCSPVCRIKNH